MAYVSPEDKAKLAPGIKQVCEKYGVKATIAVRHHSTLVVTIKSGRLDFIGNFNRVAGALPRAQHNPFQPARDHLGVNHFWCHEHFDGRCKEFMAELIKAMKGPDFFDDTDTMTDYFHCKHYLSISVGKYDKPYVLEGAADRAPAIPDITA